MNIVAVTACPTGVAHTYMAAEQLEAAARRAGHSIKVETQGAIGVEHELGAGDIAAAGAVIIAAEIAIEGEERFDGMRVVKVGVQQAIKDPDGIIARAAGTR
jgi:PTS system fructose-specific IIB component/fructose-specific PTS system IIB-like component